MAYHSKITLQFGTDLFKLLGPKAERVKWSSLSPQERKSRLNKIPVYIPTRSLGKAPTLVDAHVALEATDSYACAEMDHTLLLTVC